MMKKLLVILFILVSYQTKAQTLSFFMVNYQTLVAPDSMRFQFDTTAANNVSGWTIIQGDPSLSVKSGSIPGTSVTYTTGTTSSSTWGQFAGACIGLSNGVTNATIPYTGATGVMKEAVLTSTVYNTSNAQFVVSGLNVSKTYNIELSGTTQYTAVNSNGTYNVKGSSLQTSQNLNSNVNTANKLTWTNVAPDSGGNLTFYFGKQSGQDCALLAYIILRQN